METETVTKIRETEIETIPVGWKLLPLSEAVDFNPKRELKKGNQTKFVAMTEIQPFTKKYKRFLIESILGAQNLGMETH